MPGSKIMQSDDGKDIKSFFERALGDISKTSATKQVIIGASSGWLTGYLAMKIGKAAAFAVGGGIIILELASQKGYIKINWDKVNNQIDNVTDKVGEKITGEGSSWADKVENFVDKKLDKAEDYIHKQKTKANGWFHSKPPCHLQEIHIFLVSFTAGVALGIIVS